ncbi:hypothetical protein [Nocardia rhizosphaerae]|uniref:Thioesterase domain-containing protein n=1 Tax=Nocardia rhizosphaerae TaxID=1691571 RepID=A0ABV8LBD7_9NOCA
MNTAATEWVRVLRAERAARVRLVCFPPGGGSAAAYRDLAGHLGPAQAEQWQAVTTGPFHLRTYPGGHFYLDEQPTAVAEEITRHLS